MAVMPLVAQEPWKIAGREADVQDGLYQMFLKKQIADQDQQEKMDFTRERSAVDYAQRERSADLNRDFQRERQQSGQRHQIDMAERYGPANSSARRSFGSGRGAIGAESKKIRSQLIKDLQAEVGLSKEQADGMVGELMAESGDFRSLQELKPLVPGSKGGFGYAQWTGPRRIAFENFARQNGLDPSSYDANKRFLVQELQGEEGQKVLPGLRNITNPFDAATHVRRTFLRPLSAQAGQRWDTARDERVRSRIGIDDGAEQPQQPTQVAEQSPANPAVVPQPTAASSQQQPPAAFASGAKTMPTPSPQTLTTSGKTRVEKVIGPDGKPRYVIKQDG